MLDVRFSSRVITIPPLFIGSTTESLLRNLIDLEQCSFGSAHHITSYAILINGLIHSSMDVELLQRRVERFCVIPKEFVYYFSQKESDHCPCISPYIIYPS